MQTQERLPSFAAEDLTRFANREPGAPRCLRCGQRFQLIFRNGRVAEQLCGCGLVYKVESMAFDQHIEEGWAHRPRTVL